MEDNVGAICLLVGFWGLYLHIMSEFEEGPWIGTMRELKSIGGMFLVLAFIPMGITILTRGFPGQGLR